jgi:D-xylose transport system permease protein
VSTPTATNLDSRDPRLNKQGAWGTIKQQASQGQLGSAPVFVGLIILVVVFSVASNGVFYHAGNLVNLTQQIAPLGMISLGITLVLLLGEIDLSAASVSGLAAACVAVTSVNLHWNMTLAVIFSALVGTLVGLFQGTIIAKLGLPSFVVTLAGLLAWQGLQLYVLGADGTINLTVDGWLEKLGQSWFLPMWLSLTLAIAVPLLMIFLRLRSSQRRAAAGLSREGGFHIFGVPIMASSR